MNNQMRIMFMSAKIGVVLLRNICTHLCDSMLEQRAEELFEEVILSLSLNRLRGHEGDTCNTCTTFIETIE